MRIKIRGGLRSDLISSFGETATKLVLLRDTSWSLGTSQDEWIFKYAIKALSMRQSVNCSFNHQRHLLSSPQTGQAYLERKKLNLHINVTETIRLCTNITSASSCRNKRNITSKESVCKSAMTVSFLSFQGHLKRNHELGCSLIQTVLRKTK